MALLVRVKEEIEKTRSQIKKKKIFMAKLHEFHFELLPHRPYSPDLTPSDYFLFADLKRMLQWKTFCSNEEVIAETETYFEVKDKSFYKKDIEMLVKRWNECITLQGDYVHE